MTSADIQKYPHLMERMRRELASTACRQCDKSEVTLKYIRMAARLDQEKASMTLANKAVRL